MSSVFDPRLPDIDVFGDAQSNPWAAAILSARQRDNTSSTYYDAVRSALATDSSSTWLEDALKQEGYGTASHQVMGYADLGNAYTLPDAADNSAVRPTSSSSNSSLDVCAMASSLPSYFPTPDTSVPSPSRKYHGKKRTKPALNHTPRPPNAWILYRSEQIRLLKQSNAAMATMPQSSLSQLVAQCWREETQEVRRYWEGKAEKVKMEHLLRYPDYRYSPYRRG